MPHIEAVFGGSPGMLGMDPGVAGVSPFTTDCSVIENSIVFHEAQQKHGLPGRLLKLPDGGHGLNGYKGPSWDAWQAAAIDWLRERRMIP